MTGRGHPIGEESSCAVLGWERAVGLENGGHNIVVGLGVQLVTSELCVGHDTKPFNRCDVMIWYRWFQNKDIYSLCPSTDKVE